MRVVPAQLIDLARECEASAAELMELWARGVSVLSGACESLGDVPAAPAVRTAYGTAVTSAHAVVDGLGAALSGAVEALIETAADTLGTDEDNAGRMAGVAGRGAGTFDVRTGRGAPDGWHGGGHGAGHGGGR